MFSIIWIEVAGGFEPCELCVVVVVGGSSEDLFEEYKSPSSHELPEALIYLKSGFLWSLLMEVVALAVGLVVIAVVVMVVV